jgi:phosphopantetheinyl transferase (holo-ACP synthase)
MNGVDPLRKAVATMLMLERDQVGPETSLARLDTSLGGARLNLALKRLGLVLPAGASPSTFAELEAAVFGKSVRPASESKPMSTLNANETIPHPIAGSNGLQVGLDVQDIGSLPETVDYWQHEFYTSKFGKTEIAYAEVQSQPRTHLAGFWCAKEALRKCDPSFFAADFSSTGVAHDLSGKPFLVWHGPDGVVLLPHALSLSHTTELASAVVVLLPSMPSNKDPRPQISALQTASSSRSQLRRPILKVMAGLSSVALIAIVLMAAIHAASLLQ